MPYNRPLDVPLGAEVERELPDGTVVTLDDVRRDGESSGPDATLRRLRREFRGASP
jgi:hypothetical protein